MGKWLERAADRLSTYTTLGQAVGVGSFITSIGVTAMAAHLTAWISQYGPLGWWYAILTGAILCALFWLVIAWVRYALIKAGATRKWSERVDRIDPMATQFTKQRVSLADLVHPITQSIDGKTCVDCDLIGPINIAVFGANMNGCQFIECDIVPILRGVPIHNVVQVHNLTAIRCRIFRCSVFISGEEIPAFRQMGAQILAATPPPV